MPKVVGEMPPPPPRRRTPATPTLPGPAAAAPAKAAPQYAKALQRLAAALRPQPGSASATPKSSVPEEPPIEPATRIHTAGFATKYHIWLGTDVDAYSAEFLRKHRITRLVRCITGSARVPADNAVVYSITCEWADLEDVGRYFWNLELQFIDIAKDYGNMIFFCKRGRHRSACIAAMWILWMTKEDPDDVMATLRELREGVDFFEEGGKYPALAQLVREWGIWLRISNPAGYVPSEAA
jgi:hypothetical protein